jgi:hypothetical protein
MLADAGPVAVLEAWVSAHPRYSYTVEAKERNAAGAEIGATLRITVDMAKHTESVHVVRGSGAGSDIVWSGGDTVAVRGPGIAHLITVHMNVRDRRILSPRHNDIRTGVFARVAACFANDAAHVRTITSAAHEAVMTLTDDRGIACGPEYADGTITVDRITLDATDGHPVLRERLQGRSVVERWVISQLRIPA